MRPKSDKLDHRTYYDKFLAPLWRKAPFILRITEWKDYPVPVLVVKERMESGEEPPSLNRPKSKASAAAADGKLVERGHLTGDPQRRCLPIVRRIVSRVLGPTGIPLELERFLTKEGLRLRLNLPLDEEAGAKLALLCRLQERVVELDRVELIARRVAHFTREEAAYWLSRTTSYGADANRWAVSGLRILLGGQPRDPGVDKLLEQLRTRD